MNVCKYCAIINKYNYHQYFDCNVINKKISYIYNYDKDLDTLEMVPIDCIE